MDEEQIGKGPASFWVPRKAIEALIAARATASEIAAYLILANHTPATGDYSTASFKAIRTRSGTGEKQARAAVVSLLNITYEGTRAKGPEASQAGRMKRLVYSADEWTKRTKQIPPHGPTVRSQVRYVLNTTDHYGGLQKEIVWFGANLIKGFKDFDRPMLALRQCGDRAARMLLLLYVHNAMDEWGGVSPLSTVYGEYESQVTFPAGRTNYTVHHWKHQHLSAWPTLFKPVIEGLPDHPDLAEKMRKAAADPNHKKLAKLREESHDQKMQEVFWPAFRALESHGFLYEVVTVCTAQPNEKNPTANDFPLYELDAKSIHGYQPEGEGGLAGDTATLARDLGRPVTDGKGQFYGTYAAIAPAGTPIRVIGIYRLRFRVSNPKNATVADTWQLIGGRREEARGWIADCRHRAKLDKPATSDNAPDIFGDIFENP